MATKAKSAKTSTDLNPDPITGEPGSHPVGTGIGAAAGGLAAGAAAGAVAGPIGAVAGAVVGALAGGLGGKAVEESIDPTAEDAYWRSNYRSRPYVESGSEYDSYRSAYRYGWEARRRYAGKRFEDVETDLQKGWDQAKGETRLGWDKARPATRDAWDRLGGKIVA